MKQMIKSPDFKWNPVNISDFYAKAKALAGKSLPLPELNLVLCASDALEQLPLVVDKLDLTGNAGVLIVQDATPMHRGQADLKRFVAQQLNSSDRAVEILTLTAPSGEKLVTSHNTIDQVKQAIQPGYVVIALGSGCITDIVKHACFEIDQMQDTPVPLIAVQTANSVCAFTSQMAVLTINGVKRTIPSRMADALIMDTRVLQDAPKIYRTGGLGDVAVAAVTFADLRLAASLGMGNWNQLAYDTSSDIREILLNADTSITDDGEVGQEVAGKFLTLAGLALTLSGDTAPLSGYEHVTSHMLDMAAKANSRLVANHGHQCALATILSLLLYKHVFAEIDGGALEIERCYPNNGIMQQKINQVFEQIDPSGAAAEECAADYMQKLEKWRNARPVFEAYMKNWPAEKVRLEQHLMAPDQYVSLLRKIGHPMRFEDMETPLLKNEVRWAFHNAHLMRKRFTIGDLAFLGGMFEDNVCDVILNEFEILTQ